MSVSEYLLISSTYTQTMWKVKTKEYQKEKQIFFKRTKKKYDRQIKTDWIIKNYKINN